MASKGESLTIQQVNEFEHFVSNEIIQPFELLTHIQKVKIDIWYRALDIFSNLIDRTEHRLQMIIQAHARAMTEQSQSLLTVSSSSPSEQDQSEHLPTTELRLETSTQMLDPLQISTFVESAKCLTNFPTIKESSTETTHFTCQSHDLTNDPRMFHPKQSKYKGDILSICYSPVLFHPKHSKYKDDISFICHSPVLFHPKHSKRKDCLPTAVALRFHPKHAKHRNRYYYPTLRT
ncbi:Hypothetical protein POVR1_LOCUS237 [uncultured virus]|nr:Hypothetical protein POVR1_LOCUS237 [uncultured virus]